MLLVMFIAGACLAWLVHLILTAPEGYEDATGWHPGREPADDAGGRLPHADDPARPVSAPSHSSEVASA